MLNSLSVFPEKCKVAHQMMELNQQLSEQDSHSLNPSSVTESESDEFNDTHSVFSDVISISNRSLKKTEKKLLLTIQKLKQENITLRENLESANASDVTLLRTKLRGAYADITRLKTNNTELKERVQLLEDKVFRMLATQVQSENVDTHDLKSSIKEKLRQKALKSSLPLSAVTNEESNNNISANQQETSSVISEHQSEEDILITTVGRGSDPPPSVSLMQRCKHLEKLLRAYEKKMTVMQNELDGFHNSSSSLMIATSKTSHNEANASIEKTVEFQPDLKVGNKVNVDQQSVLAQQIRVADQKTIAELAKEVKRLTALLPRRIINSTEAELQQQQQQQPQLHDTDPLSSPSSHTSNNSNRKSNNKAMEVEGFTIVHLTMALMLGAVLMLFALWNQLSGS